MSNRLRIERVCPYCRQKHSPDWMCGPVKAYLRSVQQRSGGIMPTLTFDDPVPMNSLGPGEGWIWVSPLTIYGAVVPVGPDGAQVLHPAIVYTGRDARGDELPKWIIPGSDEELRHVAKLTHQMVELAIARASQQGGQQ